MLRITLVAGCLALSACGPSFDDKLAGTWDCTPEEKVDGVDVNIALTYTKEGKVTGEMVVDEEAQNQKIKLRGSLDGTWDYDGETLGHTMTEKFEELSVDGETIPREEIDPQLLASFRGEDDYDDPVDLVEDELIWYTDFEREEISTRCTKRGAGAAAKE